MQPVVDAGFVWSGWIARPVVPLLSPFGLSFEDACHETLEKRPLPHRAGSDARGLAFAGRSSLAADAETVAAQPQPDEQEIVIIPRNVKETDPSPQIDLARSYGEIYFSIPYIGRTVRGSPPLSARSNDADSVRGTARDRTTSSRLNPGPGGIESPPRPGPGGLEPPPGLPNNSSAPDSVLPRRPDGFSIPR
jgi:hypothetical protein